MKNAKKKKLNWSEKIDLSENIMLIVVVTTVIAFLAFVASKLL